MKKQEDSKKKRKTTKKKINKKEKAPKKEVKEEPQATSNFNDIDLSNLNIDSLMDSNPENSSAIEVNGIAESIEKLNQATGMDDTNVATDLVRYAFANNTDKPIILEKLLSDGDARIKEISTINALQTQLNITKLSALEQAVLDSLIKDVQNIAYMSHSDKLNTYITIRTAIEKAQKQIFDYIKMSSDFSSMPTIYRQLVDRLMIMPDDKIGRLKVIPQLMDVPDELWNRIVEIVNLWNKT